MLIEEASYLAFGRLLFCEGRDPDLDDVRVRSYALSLDPGPPMLELLLTTRSRFPGRVLGFTAAARPGPQEMAASASIEDAGGGVANLAMALLAEHLLASDVPAARLGERGIWWLT